MPEKGFPEYVYGHWILDEPENPWMKLYPDVESLVVDYPYGQEIGVYRFERVGHTEIKIVGNDS